MRIAKWLVPVAVLGLLISFSVSHAEDAAGDKGSISVTVVGTDGTTPVAGASVKVRPGGKGDKHGKKHEPLAADKHGAALAEGKTDADGKFTFKDIAVGGYTVVASSKTPAGSGKGSVKVEAGKTADVTITLKAKSK